jgi:hypothetical protein
MIADANMFHAQVMQELQEAEWEAEMKAQFAIYRSEKPFRTVAEEDEYRESQEALPPHKREGYAERQAEEAEYRRKEEKIDEWIKEQK